MYQFTPTGINLKIFVRETNGENLPVKTKAKRKYFPVASLTGNKAKEFYEEVLKDPCLASKKKKHVKLIQDVRSPSKSVQSKTFKNTDLLWMAQNNDVNNMQMFFTWNKNDDVNIVDEFGWTPLMCASCSGAQNAVLLLLENGADPNRSDKLGETALSLARKKNHNKVVEILKKFKPKCEIVDDKEVTEGPQSEIFFCSLCKESFKMDKNQHESSTAHLFNCPIKTSTFYGIPETNKGFQLLLREGWNKEKGLGRDGTGRKFPIKAVMKKTGRESAGCLQKVQTKEKPNNRMRTKEQKFIKNGGKKILKKISGWSSLNQGKNHNKKIDMENPEKSLKYLEEMERLGEEILTDRQEIIALDKRRNETRVGLRELRNVKDEKTWFAFGPLLVKYPTRKIEEILKKDQIQVDAEINKLRSNLKVKVNDLRDMEFKPPVPGLMLKAMTPEEMKAVGQVLGRHAD